METILQKIIAFTGQAHGEQRRKFADEPYINHPVRVMDICREYSNDITVLAAAILHDVLEDTTVERNTIRNFLRDYLNDEQINRIMNLVEELTDIYTKKQYPGLNRRQRKNKEAERLRKTSGDTQTIKYADIIDNSLDIANAEPDFAKLFLYECRALLNVMKNGDEQLRQKAVQTVNRCIEEQKQL